MNERKISHHARWKPKKKNIDDKTFLIIFFYIDSRIEVINGANIWWIKD